MTASTDQSRSAWLALLVDIGGAQSVASAAELALDGVNTMLGFDRAVLLRIEGDAADVYATSVASDMGQQRELTRHLIDAVRSSGVVTLPLANAASVSSRDIAAGLALAVHADGALWGVLVVGHSSAPGEGRTPVSALTVSMLESLASTLGMVIGRGEMTQRLEESNRRLEAYAHAAAHDLRSPLRRIRSFSQILQARLAVEEIDRAQLDDFAERIANGAERLDALLSSMLEHASTEAIAGEPHEYSDLGAIATHICDGVAELSHEPEPTFVIADLPEVRLPADAAERILRILIDRVVTFSPPERAAVVEVTAQPFSGGIRVQVGDRGDGLGLQLAEEALERFNRASRSLAIAEQLLAGRGAKLWLETGDGRGVTFVMEFPISAVRPAPLGRPLTGHGDEDHAASV